MPRWIRGSRVAMAVGGLAVLWLGGELSGLMADRRAQAAADLSGLLSACQAELTERLAPAEDIRFAGPVRVRELDRGRYRLASHFDRQHGRTRYACDAVARADGWEVTELLLVRW